MVVDPWWISESRPTDRDIQKICNKVRPVAEYTAEKAKKCKVPFPRFVAIEYKTQLEHGTKYFVKVDAGVCFVHLCIHQDYECGGGRIKLEKMLVNLDEDHPLEYFD
ncbi:cystatin-A-like [Xenia sp. Carnegie-2017]|uniref:cystatin-A-like n=1 Tax=Xenia sp. Carnegie-2017 TaxID=2897299 RepID=UPI001F0394EE|nr:cystatin-A-like [Xenia sp. Carnegie-2017]XP_046849428.1 cystatin-A-like [Xenia sp. Carnegie-2017]